MHHTHTFLHLKNIFVGSLKNENILSEISGQFFVEENDNYGTFSPSLNSTILGLSYTSSDGYHPGPYPGIFACIGLMTYTLRLASTHHIDYFKADFI